MLCRYLRLRYEDLVEKGEEEVRRLYSFMHTEVTREVTQFLTEHSSKHSNSEYYGTFRGKDFQPDHWRTQLGLERVREIEANCWNLMRDAGYQIMENS